MRKSAALAALAGLWLCPCVHAKDQSAWITAARAEASDRAKLPISLQFRREMSLPIRPHSFRIQISADNRFALYVNGQLAGVGPARGSLDHWRFETVDLAPFLKSGRNIVSAQVWNDAQAAPFAQASSGHTAFWLKAVEPGRGRMIDSGPAWRVRVDGSRTVERGMPQIVKALGRAFYAAGPPETFDAALQSRDWSGAHTSMKDWELAVPLKTGDGEPWRLVPDSLPPQRLDRVPSGRVVRATGVNAGSFPDADMQFAPHTEASMLIDAGRVLAAYPRLVLSGGADALVNVTYVESLYEPNPTSNDPSQISHTRLYDRSEVQDGIALGLTDTFKPDGSFRQSFQPFWWRTWRFLEIKVRTGEQPLTIHALETRETGYPFVQRARFVSDDPELNSIWSIGWNTALLDAHETYMDTAYWEQLQYIGDTRIQMLLSYDVSGDARLAVQALDAFDQSRGPGGLPQSAWPGILNQVIPPFALFWIGALHDYWMRQPDPAVLLRTMAGTRAVLDEFAKYVLPSGLVGPMPGWPFVDWRPGLDGWAYRDKGMLSCIITMQYVGALHDAAELENAIGEPQRADRYSTIANRVSDAVNAECWDEHRGLYADTPAKDHFSQHGAALAVLYDIAPIDKQRGLLEKVMTPSGGIEAPAGITATSYYFSFYLARAMHHAGLADRYLDFLKPWREMLHRHFTTWPETPDPSRSDSHAWSAHPTDGLLEYVAGIVPAAPGFSKVRVEPHLGTLKMLDAAMVHPSGLIETRYWIHDGALTAHITLPDNVSGEFEWEGRRRKLVPGKNEIQMTVQVPTDATND